MKDRERPRVKLGAVPYACGKSFAYPSICKNVPASYQNLKRAVIASYPNQSPRMDPELDAWAKTRRPDAKIHARFWRRCKLKEPNMWTAWTSGILSAIAEKPVLCVCFARKFGEGVQD